MSLRLTKDEWVTATRHALGQEAQNGTTCPVCDQHVQVYRWSLYSTAIKALILFYNEGGVRHFVHSTRLKEQGHTGQGDAARLRLWGLLERDETEREDGGKSGYWRVTEKGERFLLGSASIHKYAYVYNGNLLDMDGPMVTIDDIAGNKFSYRELMRG